MKGIVLAALCIIATAALSADKPLTVVPFDNLAILADNTVVDAHGTWAATSIEGEYAKKNYDPGAINSVAIACYRKENIFYEALGWVDSDGYLRELLIPYDITRWSDSEVKAEGNDLCETTELIVILGAKEITKTIRTGGLTPNRGCPYRPRPQKLISPIVMKLMAPGAAANYLRDRQK